MMQRAETEKARGVCRRVGSPALISWLRRARRLHASLPLPNLAHVRTLGVRSVRVFARPISSLFAFERNELPGSTMQYYSIISSARTSSDGGTVNPRALAVFRLITSWYFVGPCTGKVAGFSPLKMRST
jgi:hypothetical protein